VSNTLTNLLPSVYANLDVVSRELTGLIPAVTRNVSVERAAVGQTIYSFSAPAATASDITPGQEVPDAGDQSIGSVSLSITKSRFVQFRWEGEEQRGLDNGGPGSAPIMSDQIQQAIRTLTNEAETDLAALYAKASRSYGAGGTVPFGTSGDYTDASNVLKILLDNGAPNSDLQMVINTGAGANLRGKQGGKANEAGTDTILRQGVLLDIHGFSIRESAAIKTHTKGTGASATTNAAGYAIGATTITLASAGTGTIVAGDSITFAGDANQYVVASGDADVSGGGTITIAAPGLRQAIAASATAITVAASGPRSMAFRRSAIVLAHRLPALPSGGDKAVDRSTVTDPRSGLSFELAMYPGFRRMNYFIGAAWGAQVVKPEHLALLAG
jgi:P22 coat protein - gene protein 5